MMIQLLRLPLMASIAIFLLSNTLPLSAQQIKFRDVTKESGLYQPLLGIMGHGGAWGDIDGDGLIDLYVGEFADRPAEEYQPAAGPTGNRLFRNLGNGRFERLQQPAVEIYGRTSGAVFADLDNNGTLELYVANNCKGRTRQQSGIRWKAQLQFSSLFRNDNGKWVDISESSGACPKSLRTARNIGVFDYDNDGLLDLFVCEDRFIKSPRSVLFRNLGNLKFKDVTAEVGLPEDVHGLGIAVADLNNDNRPDFFVGHSNRMFLSTRDGKYAEDEKLAELFAWKPLGGEDWPCGAAFGDLNGDGLLDLVLSIHHEKARNRIFLNRGLRKDGVPQFADATSAAGLPKHILNKSPHVEIQDFDNDGRPDLYFSTAWLDGDNGRVTPLIFRNTGSKNGIPSFKPIRKIKPGEKMVYYPAGPSGDYDNDGRVDLFLINWFRGNHSRLLRNESPERNWLNVRVVGRKMNRMGIGTTVRIYQAGNARNDEALLGYQQITTGYGYASGQPAICHFGLGDIENVDVIATLPTGVKIEKSNVRTNQRIELNEPK